MEYYTKRYGLRNPIDKTEDMTSAMYNLIMECCRQYFDNIAYKYPEKDCSDGDYITSLDMLKLSNDMEFEIPDLYRNDWDLIDSPESEFEDFNQYALLDFIEFMAEDIRDVIRDWHGFFQHNHLRFKDTKLVLTNFKENINQVFEKTGLQYTLTDMGRIERITNFTQITTDLEIEKVPEDGIRELLKEAINLHKTPNLDARQLSIEKLWDAFERLKTYHTTLKKKQSADKIWRDMSEGKEEVYALVSNEFKELTNIGNEFRIRHHETYKYDIDSTHLYDYFFNRCVSLISFAISYLE